MLAFLLLARTFDLVSESTRQIFEENAGSSRVAQLIRYAKLSRYTKVAGSIPGQGPYVNQPVNEYISGTTNQCSSLSVCLPPSFSKFKNAL